MHTRIMSVGNRILVISSMWVTLFAKAAVYSNALMNTLNATEPFLFSCVKKMEINPPPGWKSWAVRMLEEEERRLKTEAEELRVAGSRVERQRCELYFLRLSPEQQAEITRETDAVGERDIPMIQEAKREQRYLELIRALMRHETTTSSR